MKMPEPVAAQHRFRHPQKTMPDWSVWQPTEVRDRKPWSIDSMGYEVEYRELFTEAQLREALTSQEAVMQQALAMLRHESVFSAIEALEDALTHGTGISIGGKRIDLMSIYQVQHVPADDTEGGAL